MALCHNFRFTFELVLEPGTAVPVGCVSVRLTFANTQCISNEATISLSLPGKGQQGEEEEELNSPAGRCLCGPVRLKSLVDVTEQSLQVFFSHPTLLDGGWQVLVLSLQRLFSSDYKDVSFVEGTLGGMDAYSRRQAWRNRTFRHHTQSQADQKVSIPVQVSGNVNRCGLCT